MPLVLTTAAVPGDSYWAPIAGGLDQWSENVGGDLYPDADGTQDLGIPGNRVGVFNGVSSVLFDAVGAVTGYTLTAGAGSSVNLVTNVVNTIAPAMTAGLASSIHAYVYDYNAIQDSRATAGPAGLVHASLSNGARVTVSAGAAAIVSHYSGTSNAAHGSLIVGMCDNGSLVTGRGSIVVGYAASGGAIRATGQGSVATGYAIGPSYVRASGTGSVAHGYIGGSGNILASGTGSFAGGSTTGLGGIQASNYGSVAMGSATSSGLVASSVGSVALGYASAGAITASGYGAFAMGYSSDGAITASGIGAVAMGYSYNNVPIVASGQGSFQLNSGTNSLDNSMKIGDDTYGIRLIGSGTTSTRDGDFWFDGTDVFVRTGGVTKNLSAI